MKKSRHNAVDLHTASIDEATRIIEESGLDALSLREVARRLGVSHQAPYKHFASRDHILAAVMKRAYDDFSDHLESRNHTGHPGEDLLSMGLAYMDYARLHPLKYRLLFNTPMPPLESHPELKQTARRAFTLLRDQMLELPLRPLPAGLVSTPNHEALFVWSLLHGLASILQSDALQTLGLTEDEIQQSIGHCFARLGMAIEPPNR